MRLLRREFSPGTVPVVMISVFVLTNNVKSAERTATAQSIEQLRYLLGSNYTYIVATYWRYLFATCSTLSYRLGSDARKGQLQPFCQFYPSCPELPRHLSCKARAVVRSIRAACCHTLGTGERIPEIRRDTPNGMCSESLQRVNPDCMCASHRIFPSPRIIGGSPAQRGEFPWIAMLVRGGTFICGVVIVDEWHGITAAHCFDFHMSGDSYLVFAGKHVRNLNVRERGMQRVRVAEFALHEDYDLQLLWNDIAVLRFSQPLIWSDNVRPACFPTPGDVIPMQCTVAGWGDVDSRAAETHLSQVLMKVTLRAYSPRLCLETFRNTSKEPLEEYLREGLFCAANGMAGQKDACQADSGGPLMCIQKITNSQAYLVFGIVSSGNGCAIPGEPGLYTNVIPYRQWIYNTINTMS